MKEKLLKILQRATGGAARQQGLASGRAEFDDLLKAIMNKANAPKQVTDSTKGLLDGLRETGDAAAASMAGRSALGAGLAGAAGGYGLSEGINAVQGDKEDLPPGHFPGDGHKHAGILTPAERLEMMRVGALMKAAHLGLSREELEKQAVLEGMGTMFDAGTKAVLVGAAVTGIPAGIMAHMLGKATRQVKLKEQAMKQEADYYRSATSGLEQGMANAGVRY